jgi:hypothetical protein
MNIPSKSQVEHYNDLLAERKNSPCSPEQQAGEFADECQKCKRKTVHQHTHKCINPDCK